MAPSVANFDAGRDLLGPALDTLPSHIAILDDEGTIVATNRSWREFAEANDIRMPPATLGVNYLAITDAADDRDANRAATGLRAVLRGEREQFTLEYPCHSPETDRWFLLRSVPFTHEGERYAAVTHVDITERRTRERALRAAYEVSASDRPFSERVGTLLTLGQDVLGLDFGTLSHVRGDEYTFEAVETPPDVDLAAGDTAPLSTLPNCERVVETADALVLRDVAAEAPELLDPEWGITAYLGAPVVVDGEVHGTFCFYSTEARADEFTDWEVTFVESLSNWVSTELERRHYTDLLTALDTAFPDLGFLIGAEGTYLDSLASPEMSDLLADRSDELLGQTLHEVLPADAADELLATVRAAITTGQLQTVEYELDVPAGTRWFEGRVAPFVQGEYGPDAAVFVARDITERKEREQKYRRLTERISDAYYAFDSDWTVTYWNDTAANRAGVPAAEIVGKNFWDVFPQLESTRYGETLQEALASREQQSCEFYFEERGYWVDIQVYPDEEGISVISQEVTERKEQERELTRQRDELAQLNRLNTLVRELIQALQDTDSRETTETAVCDRLTESALYQAAWIGVRGATVSGTQAVIPQTTAGIDASYFGDVLASEGPVRRAIETGDVQVVDDVATADEVPDERRERAVEHAHHALAAVPLTTGEVTYGVLVVYPHGDQSIGNREQTVLADLGQTIAQTIQHIHSQQALNAETVVALDFRFPDTDLLLGEVSTRFDCELTLEQWVTKRDGGAIYYLGVHDADPERVSAFLGETPLECDCSVVRDAAADRPALVELRFDDQPNLPIDVLNSHGGSMTRVHVADGDLSLGVELPPMADIRSVVDAIRTVAPTAELLSKQYVDRPIDPTTGLRNEITNRLTSKHETTLKAAYARGYYAWPRDTTVEELADTFDVTSSTLHYRLRKAHHTIVSAVVDDTPVE